MVKKTGAWIAWKLVYELVLKKQRTEQDKREKNHTIVKKKHKKKFPR
jgi:hypothetical protein